MAVDSSEEVPPLAPEVKGEMEEEVVTPTEEGDNAMKIEEMDLNKKEGQETPSETQAQDEEPGM